MVQVVVGVLVREGRVLLAHRRPDKQAFPDVWDLPGGVVEAGESELEALARELHEELGVRITAASTSHLCRVTVRPGAGEAVLSSWLVPVWEGVPANVAPEEHVDIGWFAPDEVPPLVDPRVRAAVLEAMA
ncbi:NUDIX domain-containing protein [Microbacterium sp. ARD31]|uniref:NUDIX domain-containing protein n=1 Tax=Microbacterium sp. ARD31 TaxID=2962576 RepID=UPI002882272D|nr:NUDIX domain-containing protein [Microbacterium sp. ARD31]MDT0186807.1 NUDIX domain-containing protein [Microbacterium sp. ARD31]